MAPEIRHGKGKKVYTTAVDSMSFPFPFLFSCKKLMHFIESLIFFLPVYSLGIVMWEILTLQKPSKITKRPDWSGPGKNFSFSSPDYFFLLLTLFSLRIQPSLRSPSAVLSSQPPTTTQCQTSCGYSFFDV